MRTAPESSAASSSPSPSRIVAAAPRNNWTSKPTPAKTLDALNLEVTKLELPPGLPASAALEALRAADPEGVYDFEHLYDPSGSTATAVAPTAQPEPVTRDTIEIGMIDAGIEEIILPFATPTSPSRRRCSTAAKQSRPRTARRSHRCSSAKIATSTALCPAPSSTPPTPSAARPTGGSAGDIARAIAWLVDEDVPVINISITGPKNALLEAAVRAALERGHVIVAPVGNDGPAAPVKYPAAYDGVIAVTAVDDRGRIQLDANRGPAVAFAAPGVNIRAAQRADEYASITGTSFASPIVAARFAELMPQAGTEHAAAARDTLIAAARSQTNDKRSIVYGYGVLAPSTVNERTAAQ